MSFIVSSSAHDLYPKMSYISLPEEQRGGVIRPEKIRPDGSLTSHVSIVPVGRENLSNALPPHESYEGRHRWNPEAVWSEKEEAALVWHTDLRLLSILCVMVCVNKRYLC